MPNRNWFFATRLARISLLVLALGAGGPRLDAGELLYRYEGDVFPWRRGHAEAGHR